MVYGLATPFIVYFLQLVRNGFSRYRKNFSFDLIMSEEGSLYKLISSSELTDSEKIQEIEKFPLRLLEENDIEASLKLTFEWISENNGNRKKLAIKIITLLQEKHKDIFRKIMESEIENLSSEKLLELVSSISENEDLKTALEDMIAQKLVKLVRKFGFELKSLVDLINMCKINPRCLPKDEQLVSFCVEIIFHIASFQIPASNVEKPLFVKNITNITSLIKQIWMSSEIDSITPSLSVVYTLVACNENGNPPCAALAAFLQITPVGLINPAVSKLLEQPGLSRDEPITRVACILCDWLTAWPVATQLPVWVLSLLQNLVEAGRSAPVAEVILQKLPKLLSLAVIPIVRDKVLPVVKYMLLVFQHSASAFHKIIDPAKRLMECMKRETSSSSLAVRTELSHIFSALMHHFRGYDDLYLPLQETFPDLLELSKDHLVGLLKSVRPLFFIAEENGDCVSTVPEQLLRRRSSTGKVGLINLGNTCFVNCTLQALFMNHDFLAAVLEAEPTAHQLLLIKLQYVFAFLTGSYRSVYSPSAFVKTARPPWFEAGKQQDASEFLRYLLDTMQEQEKQDCTVRSFYERFTVSRGKEGGDAETDSPELKRWKTEEDLTNEDDTISPTNVNEDENRISLVHRVFGGRLTTRYQCLECGTTSVHRDGITDISLAFPSSDTKDEVSLDDLLKYYLAREKLEGDNRYHCDTCATLRDAERSLTVTKAPNNLLLSLMRFRYDKNTHKRAKILTRVSYPELLYLPAEGSQICYVLYAVVVHSGISLDGGHYYTFARSSNVDICEGVADRNEPWYLFNDSQALTSLPRRYAVDTPYLLWYHRVSATFPLVLPKLRQDLRYAVDQDNEKFCKERTRIKPNVGDRRNDDDDSDSGPSSKSINDQLINRFIF